ncbi:hypothetical protein D3C77_338000 [compost metagenome]
MHKADTFCSEYVSDFMRIHKYSCRSLSECSLGEFSHGQHRALDMHMSIKQSGGNKSACGIDNLGICPYGTPGVANIRNPSVCDGHIGVLY